MGTNKFKFVVPIVLIYSFLINFILCNTLNNGKFFSFKKFKKKLTCIEIYKIIKVLLKINIKNSYWICRHQIRNTKKKTSFEEINEIISEDFGFRKNSHVNQRIYNSMTNLFIDARTKKCKSLF